MSWGCFHNSGETCYASSRAKVAHKGHDERVGKIAAIAPGGLVQDRAPALAMQIGVLIEEAI